MNDLPERALAALEKYDGWQGVLNALRDAERYRWLREGDNDEIVMRYYDGSPVPVMHPDKHAPCYVLRLELLDAAIDAAMNGANVQ